VRVSALEILVMLVVLDAACKAFKSQLRTLTFYELSLFLHKLLILNKFGVVFLQLDYIAVKLVDDQLTLRTHLFVVPDLLVLGLCKQLGLLLKLLL